MREDEEGQQQRRSGLVRTAGGLYKHVAGVLGAFSLVALMGHAVDLDLRGWLSDAVAMWYVTIQPATEWVVNIVLVWPLEWLFGWQLEIPMLVTDYLSVGSVLSLSLWRAFLGRELGNGLAKPWWPITLERYFPATAVMVFVVLSWPLYAFIYLRIVLYADVAQAWDRGKTSSETRVNAAYGLAPYLYLNLLLALNLILR
jgi:hypothetical protein